MRAEDRELATATMLLSGLSTDVQNQLLKNAMVREYDRGTTVFLQGERARAIYIVLSGWVKLFRITPNGTEAVVGVFTRGRSIGEAVAFRNDVYPVSAEAASQCRLLRIEAEQFLSNIRRDPEIALSMLSATFAHLHGMVAQIEALKSRTGAQRVAEFLLELAHCEDGKCDVTLPYDKVLIAGRLGMKPESLSRAFSKLREQGVKITQNRAEISDLAALRDFVEEDPALAWSRG
ncbi:cAMP-binding domain of CRP or a regulatory subunit of cAMP-dependent protein kinases [Lutimaribacter pacificus]|uniref:cAMP-binding domain of CRP or a regulatory subunit of cAMP-dependent protein kinases n=1 Tax=Lutimaribacter pacificus TaxID=391948 RepID=A0A1H0IYS2_9RHOB|nr:Crp/Fnr family transcriptional regulator [Lutimaribacter pacificus]SDO36614.1 cAMP-binding domain of CRP or a regulatory subunit of cAMP-dependent protein kinases [Lutimaribacter pacificus]SHK16052.1 cAMP-binding domain of CRP or a regulatory subunit of cAMP-dependent protein kinases [Lutimaribacter pacificus]